MDRRQFIKAGAAAVIAAELAPADAMATGRKKAAKDEKKGWDGPLYCEEGQAGPEDLTVRFLGTGASGWTDPQCGRRRHSSVLLDGKVLIDLTFSADGIIGDDFKVDTIFYTHSHGDHFDPATALKHGVRTAYVHESWLKKAEWKFRKASEKTGIPTPVIKTTALGDRITVHGLTFTVLPANHAASDIKEQAVLYLVEKGTTEEQLGVRLLYATDTGGLPQRAARLAGVDPLQKDGRPITAFVMEGTIPFNQPDDFRLFSHTSLEGAGHTIKCIIDNGRYCPPEGQPAYLTHMSTKNFPPHDELNKMLPWPLRAPYDGQEIIFRAVKQL